MTNTQKVTVTIQKDYAVLKPYDAYIENGKLYYNGFPFPANVKLFTKIAYKRYYADIVETRKHLKHYVWWFSRCAYWMNDYNERTKQALTIREKEKNSKEFLWWQKELDYALNRIVEYVEECKKAKQYMTELVEIANM